jgi:acetoin utilization deacetylase AcuC-like enzyme
METGFVFDERYMWHDTGSAAGYMPAGGYVQPEPHMESPESKRRFRSLLEVSGLSKKLVSIESRMGTQEELRYFHTEEYIEKIRCLSNASGGDAGDITPFGSGSFEIALLALGGCLELANAVLQGKIKNGYALIRPIGHHAEADRGRGFCIFGNAAITARYAQKVHGLGRVATVDWDVHHGNGTQWAFYRDPSVLTISIHQDGYYPADSGSIDETGEGDGEGYNLNIPLPAGSGHEAYIAVIERVVFPALKAFNPELIIVPSGFDANVLDPLGRMMNTSKTYRIMTMLLKELANEICQDRLLMVHEGGYSTAYVPFCGLAVMEALSGIKTEVEDPYLEAYESLPGQELQPHQNVVIKKCEELATKVK